MKHYLKEAQENLFKHLYLESIKFCNKQIDTGDKIGEALMIRSMAKAGLGFEQENDEMIEEAITDATESIKHNPNETCTYKHRAQLYALLDKFDETDEDFNKAIEVEPSYENFIEIGAIYQGYHMFEKSVKYFKGAINADDKQCSGYSGLGVSLLELDLYDEAEKCFEKAKQLGDVQAYIGLAKVKTAFKQYDEALDLVNEAIQIKPSLFYAYIEKGRLHLKKSLQKSKKKGKLSLDEEFACYKPSEKINRRQTKLAIETLELAAILHEDYLPTYLWLLLAYNNLESHKKAIRVISEIAEHFPIGEIIDLEYLDTEILSDLCYILCLSHQGDIALDICNKYLEENPDDASIYLVRGQTQYNLGKCKEAKADFYQAKEMGLDNSDLYQDLGVINYYYRNYKDALNYFILAVEKNDNEEDDTLYFLLALTQNIQHQYQEALNNINIAISINPKADYYSVKADINESLENYSLAIEYREQASNIDNQEYQLHNPDEDKILIKEFCQKHLLNIFKIDINLI